MAKVMSQHSEEPQVQPLLRHRFARVAASLVCLALGPSARAQTTNSQPQDTKTQQESLGDVARKNRPKDAQISPKRVWTTDDFESAGDKPSSADGVNRENQASPEDTVREFRSLDQEQLGTAVLKWANAPDVAFPDRKDWEQRLFEAKQAWIDQVARVAAIRMPTRTSKTKNSASPMEHNETSIALPIRVSRKREQSMTRF
jgi:hypothetical protein